MATTKKPAAKKPAAKKPAAKKPAAKKPAAKKPAAKKPAAKSATRSVAKVSPLKGKTVEWYIAQLEPWQSDLAQQIAALVTEVAPEATRGLKWSRPVWEHAGPFAWVQASKNHVTFGLWRGADIDDPDGVLEGSGDRMRHLKIARGESVPRALGAMVRQALALNAKHGDPTKRGDRS